MANDLGTFEEVLVCAQDSPGAGLFVDVKSFVDVLRWRLIDKISDAEFTSLHATWLHGAKTARPNIHGSLSR